MSPPAPTRATFGEVFALAEFRGLWLAQVLSVAGDQLARVALMLLVFDRTRSPLLAAVAFAASIVPSFVGGITLSGLADRLPRREVMIACDLLRAALVLVMAVPGIGVGALVALLAVVTMTSAPFASARAALYPDILSGDRYILGTAVTLTTIQFAQVIGFAAGGAAVGFFGVRTSLLVDAGTFVVSALITRIWVRARPQARTRARAHQASRAGMITGLRLVFTQRALRTPMLFGWLAAFYNVPEGVSAPLAASLGGGAVMVGLILAATALGASVGALSFSRLVSPASRMRLTGVLAVAACAVLILFAFHPALPLALAILLVGGLFDCYQTGASSAFVSATPPGQRSQAFGIAQGGLSLGQGTAMVLAGAAAQHYSPALVIAVSGAIGTVLALVIGFSQARSRLLGGPGRKRGTGQPQVVVRMARLLPGRGCRRAAG
ncbi:MAG TPA: MFS transporter, partial [Streptosporangiaceae bacterium]